MPHKDAAGFTKAANNQKFVRHRDVKLKQSEFEKEVKIQKLMCEGICRRCKDKVQWRFRYDKYKPLKSVGSCQNCKSKAVTKAYRTLCDACGKKKGVCPSCCQDFINEFEEAKAEAAALKNGTSRSSVVGAADEEDMAISESDEKYQGDDDDSDDEGEDREVDGVAEVGTLAVLTESSRPSGWIESTDVSNEFANLAELKYSKSRVVGTEADKELAVRASHYTS